MMKNNIFTNEQIESLVGNKYVAKVTDSSIMFTEEFKQEYVRERNNGIEPRAIYKKYNIDYNILGNYRIKSNDSRLMTQSTRMKKFDRKKGSGRPRKREFSNIEEELEFLRNELEYTKQENLFLKKNRRTGKEGDTKVPKRGKFKIIYAMSKASNRESKLDISLMCDIAQVSRSGHYSFIQNMDKENIREINDALDFALILKAYRYKNRVKGSRQIKMRLKRTYQTNFSLKKLLRLMEKFGLVCPIRKTNPSKVIMKANRSNKKFRNILSRYFKQGVALKTLLTDITYITYGNGRRAYLSTIKDSSTNMILAYSISESLEISFVIEMVETLIKDYGQVFDMNIVIHSDQVSHYKVSVIKLY
ncbi:MAG TPA: IS3 family transposase [Erysipelothrix sp.]|nr:IS3 family transposase [Erysipelothrix sp.]